MNKLRERGTSSRRIIALAAPWLCGVLGCSGEDAGAGAPSGAATPGAASAAPFASTPGGSDVGVLPTPAAPATSVTTPSAVSSTGGVTEAPATDTGITAAAGGSAVSAVPGPGTEGTGTTTDAPVDDGLPGRSLVRRLSNAEYGATVQALFGDDTDYSANFPEDTVVNGFTNNTDVQDVGPALAEQYVVASEAISAKVTQNVDALLGCPLADGETCVGDFINRFGKRAFRRPVTSTEQSELLALFRSEDDATIGVQLVVQAFLNSPSFLYRVEVGVPVQGQPYSALTSWEIASRLSYFLTGTLPDDELFAAAEADDLTTPETIEAQARRLLATPAARDNVATFFSGWLNLQAVDRLQRDPQQFPNWDSQLPPLFDAETRAFATNVVFDGAGDFQTLLTATFTYGDPSLAEYYGGTAGPVDANGQARIELPASERAGLLTEASFLAAHSKEIQTDPVSRGKFVRERMLCQGVPAPPPDLMVTAPTITPGSTTRERFSQHEEDPTCAACHVMMDPIGLAFEHYDPIGQWRDQEQGLDIDASGELTYTDVTGPFDGVVEMAAKLAQSELAKECFVRFWFRFAFGRGESDSEEARMATLTNDFESSSENVQDLLVALTVTPDFRYLLTEDATP